MTTMSFRLASGFNGRRCGLTLIEIMSAIMVLAIGLVGVLAAIPFGGFRLAQMNEADNSSLVGRDAVRMMQANGWANPCNWCLYHKVINNGTVIPNTNPVSIVETTEYVKRLNLTFPFVVDPLSGCNPDYPHLPGYFNFNANAFFTKVAPSFVNDSYGNGYGLYSGDRDARFDRFFYLPDDVAGGYDESEDDARFRPLVETERDYILGGNAEIPAFTGRYSWMATVSPNPNTDPFYECNLSDISSADYDVVVFKDRIFDDERVMKVTLDGTTGYQGGTVIVELNGMLKPHWNAVKGLYEGVATDEIDRARVLEQLETTKYIMLMGDEDVPIDGNYRKFARWYRIANYSVVDGPGGDPQIRMSLIGPDTPTFWAGKIDGSGNFVRGKDVSGIFFPGVVGVYSGSTSF